MLLSLPPELVEHIICLTEATTITSKTCQQRQDTLRALCLVSSALKEIAQPILEEAMHWPASWEGPLEEVQLDGFNNFDLNCLSGLPGLRRLVLRDVTYYLPQQSFKHLLELTLDSTMPVDVPSTAQLECSSFPSLRAFAYSPHPAAPLDPTSLTHLDTLYLDA
ncbi:hypothetical protein JCM8547_006498 [Rhodosporidiobolus lusitaniae]